MKVNQSFQGNNNKNIQQTIINVIKSEQNLFEILAINDNYEEVF